VIAYVGAITLFVAATIAIVMNDIKKVLAYSTVSQLGYMFTAVGVGAYSAGVFHLMTHAFFKACLFLGSGSVIHAMSGEQDMRKMGGLRKHMPVTFVTFLVATLALCGAPPFAGFMSKDEILWQAFAHGHELIWALVWAGAGITAFYMFRQVYMTFFGEFRGTHDQEHHLHESPPSMSGVLAVLGVLSAVGGFAMLPHFVADFKPFEKFLEPVFTGDATLRAMDIGHPSAAVEAGFSLLALAMAFGGWLLADAIYRRKVLSVEAFSNVFVGRLYDLIVNKYYIDEVYWALIVNPYLALTRASAWFDGHMIDGVVNFAARLTVLGSWLSGLFDNYIVDGLVNFAASFTQDVGGRLRRLQTGSINGYLYGILAAVMVILLLRAMVRV
jgi:NADH-quinone oxidoreductase subunit L